MTRAAGGARWPRSPTSSPPLAVDSEPGAKLLVLGWGSTEGAIRAGVRRAREAGQQGGHALSCATSTHCPPTPGDVLRSFERVLVPELNSGQLAHGAAQPLPGRRRVLHQGPGTAAVRRRDGRARSPSPPMSATLSKADFQSDQETRWCPGCGDYAVLSAVQQFMPELGIPPERIVFITGIGCAGRFAYYMDTYGMHGIHGRAPALATGLASRPRRPVDLGRDRRRRLAVDRRQPPDPRAAPQRAGQDPAVQQPDLRADQGPGLADLRARQDHQVDAVRRRRPPVQPDRARPRGRGDVRRPHDRP